MHRLALVCLFALVGSYASAQEASKELEAQRALREMHWIKGPQTVQLFGMASIDIPADYVFLNPEDTQKFKTLTQNLSHGQEYMIAPDDLRWNGFFRFAGDGYVRDDEKIDADSILSSIRKGTEEGNKERRERGWPEMTVVGWRFAPAYNTVTKRLEWAINGRSSEGAIVNFNTRILGRRGVTSVILVSEPDGLDASISEFQAALKTYQYSPSERYAAFKPGDKVAAYGLAALITGGAAAVATKTGFWKAIGAFFVAGWKLVVAAFAALIAFLKNLFKRRRQTDVPA